MSPEFKDICEKLKMSSLTPSPFLFHAIDDEGWFGESNLDPMRAKNHRLWWLVTYALS